MKALIVDDERHARQELGELLKAFPEIQIIGEAANAQEAREQIAARKPDVMFLDIQMPEESGLELLSSLGDSVPRIVFTTAYDAYAFRAFEFGAIDYLLKPISPKRLSVAVQRISASGITEVENAESESESSFQISSRALELNEKILLSDADRFWYVPVASIIGAESLGSHSVIWLANATPAIRRSLAVLETRLPRQYFLRANRSQLINVLHIQSVAPWFSGGLKLSLPGNRTVELSRRQARLFRERNTL